jgi:hypothetical protein
MFIVETFNNGANPMATMNFSVPDDVKEAFNKTFEGENKSAVITQLMVRAIDEHARRRRSLGFVERLRRIRSQTQTAGDDEIKRVRESLRE